MTNKVALRSGWTCSKRRRWLKPCARSVFIYCNFARRPFHAPALGPRVAQLGYLAVHGLRRLTSSRCRCPSPVHGTRGTTRSEGCLLLYSVVGNSLIFPISFALLAKFEAGKPCESGRNAICTASQPEFFRQRTATQQDADGVFSGCPRQD